MATLPFTSRLRVAVKAFQMVWGTYGGRVGWNSFINVNDPSGTYGVLPGTRIDYATQAGDLWLNSAVMACIGWMQRAYPEASIQVVERDSGGALAPVDGHPFTQLMERPNPYYSGDRLWQATLISWVCTGNAYWIKARGEAGYGRPVELWNVPLSWNMRPWWSTDAGEFIGGYSYRVDGKEIRVDAADVIHFRFGENPMNPRVGFSPLSAALREVSADNEGSTYTETVLRKSGAPSMVISPKDIDDPQMPLITAETVGRLRELYAQACAGDNRGGVIVPNFPADVHPVGFSPEQMALKSILDRPEDRICAAVGIPPMVAGLTSGATTKTYANYAEAREAAYENNVIPTQKLWASELQYQLFPEFGDPRKQRVTWDYSGVRCLQEDGDQTHKRAREDYLGGIITLNESRALIGQEPVPGGDTFHRPPAAGAASLNGNGAKAGAAS